MRLAVPRSPSLPRRRHIPTAPELQPCAPSRPDCLQRSGALRSCAAQKGLLTGRWHGDRTVSRAAGAYPADVAAVRLLRVFACAPDLRVRAQSSLCSHLSDFHSQPLRTAPHRSFLAMPWAQRLNAEASALGAVARRRRAEPEAGERTSCMSCASAPRASRPRSPAAFGDEASNASLVRVGARSGNSNCSSTWPAP
eukprot:2974442-Pleurochrysis_carterae.AAC.2